MIKWFYTLIFITLSFSTQATETEGKQRLTTALKSLDSIKVNFEQTVINDDNEVIQTSTGDLAIQRPKKFNWSYKTPFEQQIIADGEEIWVYDVELKQASVKPMDDSIGKTPIMILMDTKRLDSDFNVNVIGQKKFLYWIELTPKIENDQFERIYFGLEDDQIMAMDLRDTFGQSTQIVFKQHRYDVIHNPSVFRFNATPDIDIFGG